MIDTTYLSERLSELNVSDHAIARQIGTGYRTVQRIRDGANHADLTVRMVGRLGEAIGVDLAITAVAPEAGPVAQATPDDVALEAALLYRRDAVPLNALADILGWRQSRALAAAEHLQRRLASTGACLRRDRNGLAIQPRAGVLDRKHERRLIRQRYGHRGLSVTGARVLSDVLDGNVDGTWSKHASYPKRVALGELVNAGLVTRRPDGPAVPARALANSRRLVRPTASRPD